MVNLFLEKEIDKNEVPANPYIINEDNGYIRLSEHNFSDFIDQLNVRAK